MGNQFIQKFSDVQDTVGDILHEIQQEKVPVVLFGAGYCVTMFINLFEEFNIKVLAVADNDGTKDGTRIRGTIVRKWRKILDAGMDFQILITTSFFEDIEKQIRGDGFGGKVYHLPMQGYYKNTVYGLSYIKKYESQFQNAYNTLEDEISKKVYLGILKHNISLDDQYFHEIEKYEIEGYFGTELYKNNGNEIIVDAGAYDGDTIEEFLKDTNRQYENIYAFEPDLDNFQTLKMKNKNNDKVVPICAGLGERKETKTFRMGSGVSSRVDNEGNSEIEIETIDSFFETKTPPTFIKMDIEGAEEAALLGGSKIIRDNLPTLAISAYHKMHDMYYLIELIRKLSSNKYNIYMRHTFYYQKVKVQPDVIIFAVRKSR